MIQTEITNCCICDSTNSVSTGSGQDFEYKTSSQNWVAHNCQNCDHTFLKKRPQITESEKIYPRTYYTMCPNGGSISNFIQFIKSNLERKNYSDIIKKLPKNPVILDIGVGDGHVLLNLNSILNGKCKLVGIDIQMNSAIRKKLEESGIKCIDSHIEHWDGIGEGFDLVLMNQVIEHVWDPTGVFSKVDKLLNNHGVFFLETPNPNSFNRKIQGRYWGGYHFPRHLNIFSKTSMDLIAQKSFKLSKYQNFANPAFWIMGVRNKFGMNSYAKTDNYLEFINIRNPLILSFFMIIELVSSFFNASSNHRFVYEKTAKSN